ncbi:hypothetical protein N431DRAFT_516616 [Stipitochalara longipes BDJ]|nr:hypothetical protein N431DRAFT_516616 [Stipitochalara longipes BDJ]
MKQIHCLSHDVASDSQAAQQIVAGVAPEGATTVIYVRQKRLLFHQRTINAIALDSQTWLNLLERFNVMPSFLELVHENNGGNFCYVSYDEGRAGTIATANKASFHVAYKIGGWGDHETAVYARHDMATNSSFVLVVGLLSNCLEKAMSLFQRAPGATIFHVLLELATSELDIIERMRWSWDFDTQDLEAKRGHLPRYADICEVDTSGTQISAGTLGNLRDALAQKVSLAESQYDQIQQLRLRVLAQLNVTRTLITQRDMQLNIEIATAAKRDSEVMRGIAAMTMIFLPATFAATFFSMVFFQVGRESSTRFLVDGKIWLYPAITLPLTVGIVSWYFIWSWGWSSRSQSQLMLDTKTGNEDMAVSSTRAAFIARQALNERSPPDQKTIGEYPNRYGWYAQ